MTILRGIPRKQKLGSYRGRVMIDTVRGVLRVRKWPKKRGPPKSASQRFWIDWFRQANRLAKYADPMSQARAILMTKGTGLYPRDVLLKAMRGRLYVWADETGWRWYSMAAIGDISETLDVLAQTVGSVLVRAVDRWKAVIAGNPGDVLTYQGDTAPPTWEVPSGGGGAVQEQLPGTPIAPDGSASQYIFDISPYKRVTISWNAVVLQLTTRPAFRVSVDGGVTYKAGAADYLGMEVTSSSSRLRDLSWLLTTVGNGKTNHRGRLSIDNLRVGRFTWLGQFANTTGAAVTRSGLFAFDSPVTHIKMYTEGGGTFDAGDIWVVGSR